MVAGQNRLAEVRGAVPFSGPEGDLGQVREERRSKEGGRRRTEGGRERERNGREPSPGISTQQTADGGQAR
jgi:hypothetical protein